MPRRDVLSAMVSAMKHDRQTLDQRPGSPPEIRTRDGDVTFTMVPAGIPRGVQLVIRCDVNGGVWIAIEVAASGAEG
jgi:hypothetical protein